MYLLRGCGPSWEKIGTFRTTAEENSHPPVLGVENQGGQIFVELSRVTRPLEVGRHRVRLVVAGDLSANRRRRRCVARPPRPPVPAAACSNCSLAPLRIP